MECFVSSRVRISSVVLALLLPCFVLWPSEVRADQKPNVPCKVIVVGYVGGLDARWNPLSGIAQIRNRLKKLGDYLCVQTFSADTRGHGYGWLMKKMATSEEMAPFAGTGAGPRLASIFQGKRDGNRRIDFSWLAVN